MNENRNLDNALQELLTSSRSVSGDEELLRTASNYAMQLHDRQLRDIIFIKDLATVCKNPLTSQRLNNLVESFLELKKYINSDLYIMRALDSMSLKKFIERNGIQLRAER